MFSSHSHTGLQCSSSWSRSRLQEEKVKEHMSYVSVDLHEHKPKQVFKELWFINKDSLIYTISWLDENLKFQGEMTQFQNEAVCTQHQAIQMKAWANHLGMRSLLAQTFQVVIGNT